MTAIIVDDEKNSREVLETMLRKYCPEITVIKSCSGAAEVLDALQKEKPDILFLDIEMPGMNGFEMLEHINQPGFEIIFTTSYSEYAIKAIKHSALDYLLKPIDKDELIYAVQKAARNRTHFSSSRIEHLLELLEVKKSSKRFAVSTSEGLIVLNAADIAYCESDGPYCRFYFANNKTLVTSKTLKETEEALQDCDFCRIHHSYLINMKYVDRYIRGEGGEVVLTNGKTLPVSRTKKQDFLQLFEKI
ncbi:MAG TPA: response regulator [Chitinophagaceae bacterium]